MSEIECVCVCVGVCVCTLSHVQLFATPGTIAHQASWPMEYSRQETEIGSHFLVQGILLTRDRTPVSCVS